jgi:hypothetical protein
MRNRPRRDAGSGGALATCEGAFGLLRAAGGRGLALYGVGTVPFLLALLAFWADMSRSAFAASRVVPASLGLAALFLWMKCWHAAFAAELRAVAAQAPEAWTWRRALRLAAVQCAVQPHGLWLLPAALLTVFAFGPAYAWFQNMTVMGDGSTTGVRALGRRAWQQATVWPVQNHVVIWLLSPWMLALGMVVTFGASWLVSALSPALYELQGLFWFLVSSFLFFTLVLPTSPFGCTVAGNAALMLAVLPALWKGLTGAENVFTLSGYHAILNTTFLLTVFAVAYLCLDPLVKAAYVLRCFHGEAQTTGEDIRVALRQAGPRDGDGGAS